MMIVVVDGYNVLKYDRASSVVSERDIVAFVALVSARARFRRYKVMVVFDGGSSSYPVRMTEKAGEVMYAGFGASADDMIIEMSKKYQHSECVVVSADRRLCAETERYGAFSLSPHDYLKILSAHRERTPSSSGNISSTAPQKMGEDAGHADIDMLMEMASRSVQPKDADRYEAPTAPRIRHYTSSKKMKQLQHIMDKL